MLENIKNYFRSKIPEKLFARFVLIVLLPMFLMQLISMYIFFCRYWDRTIQQNVEIVSTEIFALNNIFNEQIVVNDDSRYIVNKLKFFDRIEVNFFQDETIKRPALKYKDLKHLLFNNPMDQLENRIYKLNLGKTALYRKKNYYYVEVEKQNGVLTFSFKKNKIYVQRLDLIIFWNILSFLIIGSIALIYLKNQIKSIIKLKVYVNDFSYLEKDNKNFKPTGAKEIKETGVAILNMIKKMKRLINNRTNMLAQISHDLRTPLTRMKLQTEFLDNKTIADFFKKDLEEMEKLINEYLLFAKGENENDFKKIKVRDFFNEILADYTRSGYENIKIVYDIKRENVFLKFDSFRRCINNLINNAIKYSKKQIEISVKTTSNNMTIIIEDDGEGIAKDMFEKIQLIFYKCSSTKTDGVGLGLFIVKNVVNMHKGKIYFDTSQKLGGLKVMLKIPILKK